MNKTISIGIIVLALLSVFAFAEDAKGVTLDSPVNDYATAISDETETQLTALLDTMRADGTVDMTILLEKQADGTLEDQTKRLYDAKYSGIKNGVLLVILTESNQYRWQVPSELDSKLNYTTLNGLLNKAAGDGNYNVPLVEVVKEVNLELSLGKSPLGINKPLDLSWPIGIGLIVLIIFFVVKNAMDKKKKGGSEQPPEEEEKEPYDDEEAIVDEEATEELEEVQAEMPEEPKAN